MPHRGTMVLAVGGPQPVMVRCVRCGHRLVAEIDDDDPMGFCPWCGEPVDTAYDVSFSDADDNKDEDDGGGGADWGAEARTGGRTERGAMRFV